MKGIKNTNLKILLTFFPLLILYGIIVIFFQRDFINADELRYITYAKNLVSGAYAPNGEIWNGPGYPFILYPFELFNISVTFPRLLNSVFLYLSVIFISKTLSFFISDKNSIRISYALGLYYPFFKPLILAMTEIITVMLICLAQYLIVCYFRKEKFKKWYLIGAALSLAYLAMVKIIFGYVILSCLIVVMIIFLIQKSNKKIMLAFVKIFALALFFCTPYLTYTYTLVGKFFYWGRPGYEALYWMTSKDNAEFGDYYSNAPMDLQSWRNKEFNLYPDQFIVNHKKVMDQVSVLPPIQADSVWYSEAIKNIKEKPAKFVLNCIANLGRILFSYPQSYQYMNLKPFYYIIPNMFIIVTFILILYPAVRHFRKIPIEIRIFLLFTFFYLGASILVTADVRQIFPLIPAIAIYLSFMVIKMIKISIQPDFELEKHE
jgi:hypothetical protein